MTAVMPASRSVNEMPADSGSPRFSSKMPIVSWAMSLTRSLPSVRPSATDRKPASTSTWVRCALSGCDALAARTTHLGTRTRRFHSSPENMALPVTSTSPSGPFKGRPCP